MNRSLAAMVVACALSLTAKAARADAPIADAPTADAPTADAPTADAPTADAGSSQTADPRPDPVQPAPPEVDGGALSDAELAKLSGGASQGEVITIAGSPRGVAEDFLVLPDGAELGGQLRVITADDGLGTGRIKLTDLALFDVNARWAFARGFELDGTVSVLAKQPSSTSEHVLQGGSLTVRRDLFARTALAVAGSAGPLLGLKGFELGVAAFVTHRHWLTEYVDFALAAGANSTFVRPTRAADSPYLFEGAGHAAVQVAFNRVWGGWMGAGYALPVFHRGHDPVGGMPLAPQPRLDLNIGNAVQMADNWDLSIELTIIDRGDRADPATRLPILDGGFDQIQLIVGISRRLDLSNKSRPRSGLSEPVIKL